MSHPPPHPTPLPPPKKLFEDETGDYNKVVIQNHTQLLDSGTTRIQT